MPTAEWIYSMWIYIKTVYEFVSFLYVKVNIAVNSHFNAGFDGGTANSLEQKKEKGKRSKGRNWPRSSGRPAQSWIPTRGMVPRHQLAVERAHDDISVCLWPGQLRLCVIKGKTINMELDSTGPTALKVTDSPLLWLVRATVWYKQHWPANCYYCACGFL